MAVKMVRLFEVKSLQLNDMVTHTRARAQHVVSLSTCARLRSE